VIIILNKNLFLFLFIYIYITISDNKLFIHFEHELLDVLVRNDLAVSFYPSFI
jgi:hypothetical protein